MSRYSIPLSIRARAKAETGQALLEMALVTPLLLLLVLGVIEIGRYAFIGILVGNAAHAGALYGAQGTAWSECPASGSCGIVSAADNDYQNNGQALSSLTVRGGWAGSGNYYYAACTCDNNGTYTPDPPEPAYCYPPTGGPNNIGTNTNPGTCSSGHWVILVSVEAKGTYSSLFNYPGIPSPVTIDRTATIRVAN